MFKAKLPNGKRLRIGGSGCGKTRSFIKPNLMQIQGSYIITDPKSEIISNNSKGGEKNGGKG